MIRRVAIAVGLCGALAGAMLTARATRADEVVDNALVAHKKLARLHRAVLIYLNDDSDQRIDDPLHLFPNLVSDPTLFWHPGDNDPMPATIANSIPNQPNSAQISFIFRTGAVDTLRSDEYMIWDASPTNNDGRFISGITVSGLVETIPPSQVPVPTRVTVGQHRLCEIGSALKAYLNDSEGWLPQDLRVLHGLDFSSPRSFWNPGDGDPMPTAITNAEPDTPNSAHISFDFPAAGMHASQLSPETIIVQDNSPANNGGLGISVYRSNGSCAFQLVGLPGDINSDQRIDLADWAKLQRCFQEWDYLDLVEDDTCRVFDFNGDSRVTSADHVRFLSAMTGPATP